MNEIWKDVVGFEGLYKISNLGNVYSTRSNKLLFKEDNHGYLRTTLRKNNKVFHKSIHVLVAEAFIPNPDNLPCINHKDENKSNNCVDNLEWCTYSYNINYGTRNLRVSEHADSVKQLTLDGTLLATYSSVSIAAALLNLDHSTIYKCCRKEIAQAYGYYWELVSNDQ